jgi:hypothetical protein
MLNRYLCLDDALPIPEFQPAFTRSAQYAACIQSVHTLRSLPRGLLGPLETLDELLHPVYEQLLLVL